MSSDGPPPPRGGAPGGGAQGESERLWQVRIGQEVRQVRDQAADASRQAGLVAGQVAEILPRLDDVQTGLAALSGVLAAAGGEQDDETGPLSLTPALRWSQLSRDDTLAGWEALSGWVVEVLHGDYRLTRVELPDCWPVHPRAVRELAWLRTSHLTAAQPRTRPDVVAEWHTRWLPAALGNLATAIDPRECAPGRHRLTEEERRQHELAIDDAARSGQPARPVSAETGPDRPRYLPDRFPPRRSYDPDPFTGSTTRPQSLDPDTPPPSSSPDCWWEYYLDARDADLSRHMQQQ